MSDSVSLPRSAELMARDDTGLVVVDVQEKLLPHIEGQARVAWNVSRLARGAKLLGLPTRVTEQYPQGLGPTVAALLPLLPPPVAKRAFSCGECGDLFRDLGPQVHKLLVCGLETHVCVAQTALDLLAAGFRIYLAVDATGSRQELDYRTALRRMESSGVTLTTTEAALFEWCATAAAAEFKQISALVREPGPRGE